MIAYTCYFNLIILSIYHISCTSNSNVFRREFVSLHGRSIISTDQPFVSYSSKSRLQCAALCLEEAGCQGYNHRHVIGGIGSCDVMTSVTIMADLQSEQDSTYYERLDHREYRYQQIKQGGLLI